MSLHTPELKPPQAEELSREVLISRLVAIADAGAQPESLQELNNFVLTSNVKETFSRTIFKLGIQDTWFGDLIKGARAGQDRVVSASFQAPPALNGGSMLHVHAVEGNEPSFGVVLPFDETGALDTSRVISASSFLTNHKVSSFLPVEWIEKSQADPKEFFIKQHPTVEEAAQSAKDIAMVIQMAAATLVSLLELEDVSAVEAA